MDPEPTWVGGGHVRELCNFQPAAHRSFCLNFSAGELDHLAPLLDFFGDEPAEVGRRAGKRRGAELRNPCLRPRIGKSGVELLVEPFHDLGRRTLWRADAIPGARLIAWQSRATASTAMLPPAPV